MARAEDPNSGSINHPLYNHRCGKHIKGCNRFKPESIFFSFEKSFLCISEYASHYNLCYDAFKIAIRKIYKYKE